MKFTFVSNYINHHQIPFAEAVLSDPELDFEFIQTMPMEEERIRMGWSADLSALPWVRCLYDDETAAVRRIMESDMVLFGWTERFDLGAARLAAGRPMLRVSERIYREGQWKAVSPRGLMAKYREHTAYRREDCWMLCSGAYVASDFALVRSYPGKCFRWGYFPALRRYEEGELEARKGTWQGMPAEDGGSFAGTGRGGGSGVLRLLYAGRFAECKHPEFALALAERLRERGVRFRLDMVGGGEMDAALREEAARLRFSEEQVSFRGYLPPDEVRTYMERAHIFLFPSNHLEGWGAVMNEAMNSGCAVIAGTESGAAPYLIRQGENGVLFERESRRDFLDKADWLIGDPARIRACGQQAQRTIEELWNAERAARELLRFTRYVLRSRQAGIRPTADGWDPPAEGPMSLAPVQRPFVKAGKLP